jgi:predicted ferric reductase
MILLAVTSLWRRRIGLSYEAWRMLHVLLTMVAVLGTYTHILVADEYSSLSLQRAATAAITIAAAIAFVYLRVGRAFAAAAQPYRLAALVPEGGDATTLELVADGHPGIQFMPGQFAWLRCAGAPYAIAEHPFTVASSTLDARRVSFTAKRLGDHTGAYPQLAPGTLVFVDGPHGTWVPPQSASGLVLVSAGIGITPAIGVVRTLVALGRSDVPVQLVYGARRVEDLVFHDELLAATNALDLELVVTLTQPPHGWHGRTGRITPGLLTDVAPHDVHARAVFACGPTAMLDPALAAYAALGTPATHLHAERFDGV